MMDKRITAPEAIGLFNFREAKARQMTAAIMREVDDLIQECDLNEIYYRIFRVLAENGAGWTTDEERARLGLEPRDVMGWTPSERVKMEEQRQLLMTSLICPIFKPPEEQEAE